MTSTTLDLLTWSAVSAAGLLSFMLLTGSVVTGLRIRAGRALPGLGRDETVRIHRHLTGFALIGLCAHVVLAIADPYTRLGFDEAFLPFTAPVSRLAYGLGSLAVWLVAVIALTSIARRFLPVRLWRAVHLSAYAMWGLALAHAWLAPSTAGTATLLITGGGAMLVALTALDCRLVRRSPTLLLRRNG